jgi:hypothetical protein
MTDAARIVLRRTPGFAIGLALLLGGCAGLVGGREEAPRPATTPSPGSVLVQTGRPGIVIGAPRGGSDRNTDVIAGDLARLTGFGLVVMRGPGGPGVDSHRLAVTAVRLDPGAREAWRADEAYRRHVAEAAQGPLALYIEVRGDGPGPSPGHVGIRTVGLGPDDAWRLRTLFELIRDSRLEDPAVPRLEARVESAEGAGAGPPVVAPRALHIDLPVAARTTYRDAYTRVLGAFLSESVAVLVSGRR